ncbi:MAG TPA: NAD(P)/FAD-dependent oxidoreductase [Gemmatimonadaceae bacterium]|nr:NAD(P)/FAD-dependent oxidoreductase [Gemmatimonadaceae bacterium]
MNESVAIIGAGVAGLSAAAHLAEQEIPVTVLEARDRIGGRLWSLHPEGLEVPVELGGEFLHGETPEIMDIATRARLRTMDIAGRRWTGMRGELRLMDDFWERVDRVMRKLKQDRQPDQSFASALERMRGVAPADVRLARQFVEGFHAADTNLISEQALAEGGSPRDDVRERRIGRVIEGFDGVVNFLANPVRQWIRLQTVVRRIRWERGHVTIETAAGASLQSRAAIITVPLGVLQAIPGEEGAIEFDPPLPAVQRAAHQLAMGAVIKVVLRLDEPFWTGARFAKQACDDRFDTLSFLHASDPVAFPVWWTPYPIRAPQLVGWCGGPAASALAGLSAEEIIVGAIDSLATILGMPRKAVQRHVITGYTHDWISDPCSRGAYSYVRTGGSDAAKTLTGPVERTLFFAGEHADAEGRSGTVHGAIASGQAAAKALLKALR